MTKSFLYLFCRQRSTQVTIMQQHSPLKNELQHQFSWQVKYSTWVRYK